MYKLYTNSICFVKKLEQKINKMIFIYTAKKKKKKNKAIHKRRIKPKPSPPKITPHHYPINIFNSLLYYYYYSVFRSGVSLNIHSFIHFAILSIYLYIKPTTSNQTCLPTSHKPIINIFFTFCFKKKKIIKKKKTFDFHILVSEEYSRKCHVLHQACFRELSFMHRSPFKLTEIVKRHRNHTESRATHI